MKPRMIVTCAQTSTRSDHLGAVAAAEQVRDGVRDRRPLGRVLVQAERDPRGVPADQRHDDARDREQDQVGLAQVAAVEPARPLDLADRERGHHADEHHRREHVDQEREPALLAEPRDRRGLRDDPDQRHHDRREQHDEAPEDERVHEAGDEALEQLALARDDHDLVLDRAVGTSSNRGTGLPSRMIRYSCRARRAEQAAGDERSRPRARRRRSRQPPRRRRISAAIAGTTSCRSPITA